MNTPRNAHALRASSFAFTAVASLLGVTGLLSGGCSSAPIDPSDTGSTSDALTASDAVSRAAEWARASLQYCQAPYGGVDPDDACWSRPWETNHRCYRTENPAWDAYRSDCSGLISWAWGLPAPGRTTWDFAPFHTDITRVIDGAQLRPGDAVNNRDHIMLFTGWVIPGQRATFIEEPGCGKSNTHAHAFTSDVSIHGTSVYVPYSGMTFTAIRYERFGSGGGGGQGGGCVVGGLYCGGDKVNGDKGALYRCTGGSSGELVERCAAGCAVHAGDDDACNPESGGGGGGCVVGALYCGGDKVTGDKGSLYRCTGGSAGDLVERCAHGCSVTAGKNDACNSGGETTGAGHCTVGGLYCGGDEVTGNSGTLYRCTGGSAGVAIANCHDGCQVRSGQDDVCRGSGDCVVGGLYCGGDKVTGDPSTLYKCTGGSSGTVVEHCAKGCAMNSGDDDACR